MPIAALCLTLALLYWYDNVQTDPLPAVAGLSAPSVRPVYKEAVPTVGVPVRLKIASIDVDAKVVPVGLTTSGAMAISQTIGEVVWYKFGSSPGEVGSAVIAGHYGWNERSVPAVFNDLQTLKVGNKLSVYDKKGERMTFVVREMRKYDLNADTTEVFRSKDGKAHLNLITCNGKWDGALRTYTTRLVVFTDKV